ncbi:hypothetical protein TIFTF001_021162 [Ficus carica]|uniref:Uncharacterized protein n=1 Tax=Ficus carica TaxID=3494 RepID=A0AA88AF96_FICCA|nr:hypothetical protein TIFTF001_021162 [Ficus carica]
MGDPCRGWGAGREGVGGSHRGRRRGGGGEAGAGRPGVGGRRASWGPTGGGGGGGGGGGVGWGVAGRRGRGPGAGKRERGGLLVVGRPRLGPVVGGRRWVTVGEEKREKGEERERGSPAAGRPELGPEVGHQRRGGSPASVADGGKVAGDGEDLGWESLYEITSMITMVHP